MTKKKKGGRPDKYDAAFKITVAREYLQGDLGYGTLGSKYGLSAETVRSMVLWYKKHYDQQMATHREPEAPQPQAMSATERELQRQLKEAQLKITGLEMLIEVAREELGIDIRKKPGTKQSSE